MAPEWYYQTPAGRTEGPVSAAALKQLARLGEIGTGTAVRKGVDGWWVAANKVKGLVDATPVEPWLQPDPNTDGKPPAPSTPAPKVPASIAPSAKTPWKAYALPDSGTDVPSDHAADGAVPSTKMPDKSTAVLIGGGVAALVAICVAVILVLREPGEREKPIATGVTKRVDVKHGDKTAEQQRKADQERQDKERRDREVADRKALEEDRERELWRISGREIRQFCGNDDTMFGSLHSSANTIAFSSGGRFLAAVSYSKSFDQQAEGAVYLWDTSTGQVQHRFVAKVYNFSSDKHWSAVAFTGDEKYLAAGRGDGSVHVWETDSGKEIATLLTPEKTVGSYTSRGAIYTISFSTDGRRIIGGGVDRTEEKATHPVWVWSVNDQRLEGTLAGHSNIVISSDISKDGYTAVTGSWDRTAILWNLKTGKEQRLLALQRN